MENLFASNDVIQRLFDLQGEDALLGQLEHQVKTLPEREKLFALNQMKIKTEDLIRTQQNESDEQFKKEITGAGGESEKFFKPWRHALIISHLLQLGNFENLKYLVHRS